MPSQSSTSRLHWLLVLNGKSTRLVKVSGTWESTWRLENDDASIVTRSTDADNGDDNGEHWTVITGDGTKYVFGLNKLAGAADQRTNSTWTVPVFGDEPKAGGSRHHGRDARIARPAAGRGESRGRYLVPRQAGIGGKS